MSTGSPRYVALGSSYAAGPGIPPLVDRAADRSGRNYPHLLAARLGLELIDRTVSGATTATILDQAQETDLGPLPPQIDGVTPDTDLVTITAGGNDLGYIGSFIDTAWQDRMGQPAPPILRPSPQAVDAAAGGLTRIVAEARLRAPGCRVLLVDYLPILDPVPDTDPGSVPAPFLAAHIPALLRLQETLDQVFVQAARRSGAELVASADGEQGHGLGTSAPWVQPLIEDPDRVGASFHPNAAGMAAVADRLAGLLRD
jgi:lysophospholipase L1-like esterase